MTAGILAWLLSSLFAEGEADKSMFLPGETTIGHYQIEMACTACHSEAFGDREALQNACTGCHAEALKAAKDDHPKSKFTDPRNADRIEVLDARYCVTCHVEHRPEITGPMGFTQPADTCFLCHEEIAEDRPSHAGMKFDTCASAGCHNFHDNRALYEDFLLKHMDDASTLLGQQQLLSNLKEIAEQLPAYPLDRSPIQAVSLAEQVLPSGIELDEHIAEEWLASSHAKAGVGCVSCHAAPGNDDEVWIERPNHSHCASCHKGEVTGFLDGRHGMRMNLEKLGRELSPMTTDLARLPMHDEATGRELSCQSCHSSHRYDARSAQVESCVACHADEHSTAYKDSPHYKLWEQELAGELPQGSGVTCASCHMPRIEKDYFWGTFVHNEVQHNQSENIRPNEKMLRPVCLQCHGLGFSIDSLADEAAIRSNFSGPPTIHIPSIDLARQRIEAPPATRP